MGEGRAPVVPILVVCLVAAVAGVVGANIDRPPTVSLQTGAPAPGASASGGMEITLPLPGPAPPSTEPALLTTTRNGLDLRLAAPVRSPIRAADAIGSRVALYSRAGEAEPGEWLDNPTWEGLAVVFLVHEQRGDWLRVQVSMRPNQATAWVKASDVKVRPVPYRVVVDVPTLRLTVLRDEKPIFEAPVAVGKGATPTPTGYFFVDGIVALSDTSGPYGSHQVSVAAFSEVYTSFAGGVGQIALHGTNQPNLIGTPVSNGCVRLANADIAQVAALVPTGTPVEIIP